METCVVLVVTSFLFGISTAFFLLRKEVFQTNNCQRCTNTQLGLNAVDDMLVAKNRIIESCKRMVSKVRSLVYDVHRSNRGQDLRKDALKLLKVAGKVLDGDASQLFEDIKYEMYFAVLLMTCGTAAVVLNQFNNMAQENYLESFAVPSQFPERQPAVRASLLTIMTMVVLADWKFSDAEMGRSAVYKMAALLRDEAIYKAAPLASDPLYVYRDLYHPEPDDPHPSSVYIDEVLRYRAQNCINLLPRIQYANVIKYDRAGVEKFPEFHCCVRWDRDLKGHMLYRVVQSKDPTTLLERVVGETGVAQYGRHLRSLEVDRTCIDVCNNDNWASIRGYSARLTKGQLVVVMKVRRVTSGKDPNNESADHFMAYKYYPLLMNVSMPNFALAVRQKLSISTTDPNYNIFPTGKLYNTAPSPHSKHFLQHLIQKSDCLENTEKTPSGAEKPDEFGYERFRKDNSKPPRQPCQHDNAQQLPDVIVLVKPRFAAGFPSNFADQRVIELLELIATANTENPPYSFPAEQKCVGFASHISIEKAILYKHYWLPIAQAMRSAEYYLNAKVDSVHLDVASGRVILNDSKKTFAGCQYLKVESKMQMLDEAAKNEIQRLAAIKAEKQARIEDATEGSPERVWLFALVLDLTLVLACHRHCYPDNCETRDPAEERLKHVVQLYVEDGATFVEDMFAIPWNCEDGKRALFERTFYLLFTLTGQRVDTVCRSVQETMAKMMKKKVEKKYQCYSVSSSEETTAIKNLFTEHSMNGEPVSIDVPPWFQGLLSHVWFQILVPLYEENSAEFVVKTCNKTINKRQESSDKIFIRYLGCSNYTRRRLTVGLHDKVFSVLPSQFREELMWFIVADQALEKVASGKGHTRAVEVESYGGKKNHPQRNASTILDKAVDHPMVNERGSLLRAMVEETIHAQRIISKRAKLRGEDEDEEDEDEDDDMDLERSDGEKEEEEEVPLVEEPKGSINMEVSSSEATTGAEVIADEMSRTDASRSNEPRKKFADQRHKYDVCVRNEETLVRIGPSNHGQGAFATATIPRGTRVAIYDGQSFGVLAFGVIIMDLMLVYGPHVPEFDIWMSGILISLIFLTFALVCEAGIKGGYIFFSIGAWFLSLIRIK